MVRTFGYRRGVWRVRTGRRAAGWGRARRRWAGRVPYEYISGHKIRGLAIHRAHGEHRNESARTGDGHDNGVFVADIFHLGGTYDQKLHRPLAGGSKGHETLVVIHLHVRRHFDALSL